MTTIIDVYEGLKNAGKRLLFVENRQQELIEKLIDKGIIGVDKEAGIVKSDSEADSGDNTENTGQEVHS